MTRSIQDIFDMLLLEECDTRKEIKYIMAEMARIRGRHGRKDAMLTAEYQSLQVDLEERRGYLQSVLDGVKALRLVLPPNAESPTK